MANKILSSEYDKELWLNVFRQLNKKKKLSEKDYEKDRMFLKAFRQAIAKNKASTNPIPDGEIPPEMAKLVAQHPNMHIETLGNVHTLVINDSYD